MNANLPLCVKAPTKDVHAARPHGMENRRRSHRQALPLGEPRSIQVRPPLSGRAFPGSMLNISVDGLCFRWDEAGPALAPGDTIWLQFSVPGTTSTRGFGARVVRQDSQSGGYGVQFLPLAYPAAEEARQRETPTSADFHAVMKRGGDVVASLVLLLILTPIFVVAAVLIKLTDGGPILYWHRRVGRWGTEFWFPKFRSMIVQADKTKLREHLAILNHHREGPTFKIKNDPRVTRIGRILRRFSIDELPQLWCVLRGHMSLVGPRPALPREVAQYSPHDRRRLEVMPGLTGIWQVRGRGDLPFARQVELDIEYIENQGLWMDFKLLLLTIPAVLSGKGAY